MSGATIEATLELWASSLRDVKERIRPLFTQDGLAHLRILSTYSTLRVALRTVLPRRSSGLPSSPLAGC